MKKEELEQFDLQTWALNSNFEIKSHCCTRGVARGFALAVEVAEAYCSEGWPGVSDGAQAVVTFLKSKLEGKQ